MLVSEWTINGTLGSSYTCTMGFGVSARVQAGTTRLSSFLPHYFSVKSIYYQTKSKVVNSLPGGRYG